MSCKEHYMCGTDCKGVEDFKEKIKTLKKERDQLKQQLSELGNEYAIVCHFKEKVAVLIDEVRSWRDGASKLQQRLRDAEEALKKIRDQDYRGNRCSCMQIAFKALNKHSENRCKHDVHSTDCFECYPSGKAGV